MLRTLISFLDAGYSLGTCLNLLERLSKDVRISQLKRSLEDGHTLEEAFMRVEWDPLFLEYFIFQAIEKSLGLPHRLICLCDALYFFCIILFASSN